MSQSVTYNTYSSGALVFKKRKLDDIKSPVIHLKELESITPYAIRQEDLRRFNENLLNLRSQPVVSEAKVIPEKLVKIEPKVEKEVLSFHFKATELSFPVRRSNSKFKPLLKKALSSRWLSLGAASLVLLTGLAIFVSTIKTNQDVAAQVSAVTEVGNGVTSFSADVPSENPLDPSTISKYKVSADLPRLLKINKLGIEGRVLRMGLLADSKIASPDNIFDTGWYEGSSKPGEAGASLIVGHVSGPSSAGIFKNLHKLNDGDIISVEKGDGTLLSYKVISKKQSSSAEVDMSAALSPVTKGKNGLNLMTCAGKYDKASNTFQDRLVIFTEQV